MLSITANNNEMFDIFNTNTSCASLTSKEIITHFTNSPKPSKNESVLKIANTLYLVINKLLGGVKYRTDDSISGQYIRRDNFNRIDIQNRNMCNKDKPKYNLEVLDFISAENSKVLLNREINTIVRFHRNTKRGRIPKGMKQIAKIIWILEYTNTPMYFLYINKGLCDANEQQFINGLGLNINEEHKLSGLSPLHLAAHTGDTRLFKDYMKNNKSNKISLVTKSSEHVIGFAILNNKKNIIEMIVNDNMLGENTKETIKNILLEKPLFSHGPSISPTLLEYLYSSTNKSNIMDITKFLMYTLDIDSSVFTKCNKFKQTLHNELYELTCLEFEELENGKYKLKNNTLSSKCKISELLSEFDADDVAKYIDTLLTLGGNINIKIPIGTNIRTPLLNACIYNNTIMADILIERGADITITTEQNDLPLHWAINKGNLYLVKKLTNDKTIIKTTQSKSDKYITALKLAKQFKHDSSQDIITYLSDYEATLSTECPVCWCSGKRCGFVVGKCNHSICATCFSGMIRVNGYNDILCPYCRAKFTKD